MAAASKPKRKAPAKRPIGRPSTYRSTMVQKAIDYANGGYAKQKRAVPTIEGFAKVAGVALQTIYRWGEAHPEFRDALDYIKSEQREILISHGLCGDFNPTITKLILSANHGMHERTETEHDGSVGVFEIDYTGAAPQENPA